MTIGQAVMVTFTGVWLAVVLGLIAERIDRRQRARTDRHRGTLDEARR